MTFQDVRYGLLILTRRSVDIWYQMEQLTLNLCEFYPGACVLWRKNPACEGVVVATAPDHCRVLWAGLYETYIRNIDLVLDKSKKK